ncbi:Gfo/Idh/MocA family protein [Cohnella cellulosilytica]|uniref:Gfo/Idh/MocA family protein n=1 Tax=Cohnella cellulosilytica TaxID=986710 RepID=A0ABW2F589_9BACL
MNNVKSNELKLCMIGAGEHAGRNVYPSFAFIHGANVVANCDLNVERARALARQCGIEHTYADYREMLEKHKPDGVLICVGPDFHAKVSMELMRAGYHVYTEKPPAVSYEQAKQVVAVSRETGKICMTGLKKRFAPAYRKAKEILDNPENGQPEIMSFIRTENNMKNTDDPKTQFLLDACVHPIDLCNYFFGKVKSLYASHKEPATYAISLKHRNGAVSTMTLTDRINGPRRYEEVTIVTDKSTIVQVHGSIDMLAFREGAPIGAYRPDFAMGRSHSIVEQGFSGEIQEFIDAIRENRQPVSHIEQSSHAPQIYEAIKKSIETGQTVFLEED